MCGRAYSPDFMYLWPNARISVMGGAQVTFSIQHMCDLFFSIFYVYCIIFSTLHIPIDLFFYPIHSTYSSFPELHHFSLTASLGMD